MATLNANDIIEQLNWRYATKEFDSSKTIPAETIAALEEALVLTPSSFGLQPWKFYIVEDAAVKEQLPAVSWNQQQPKDCSHLVVLAARKGYKREDVGAFVARMAEVRGVSEESLAGYEGFAGGFVDQANEQGWIDAWAQKQVYIALGQLMFAAAALGVDACPMEGIDPAAYDRILGLEDSGYSTVVACPLGYRAAGDKYATTAKVRFEKSDLIQRI
ncbi:NAD(P)H-dependent oxidoreductase [Pelagicoccus sp. SDUM812005]|uniref:NAD(P)H-dependent oxidoreductase n=1 Tax=Pelagicoccus sp. SDUM812005 TaxID=3041257 RepID=UPI00280F3EF7|nr:NAD(P)H-dependent oxidoreductase [Pelagicoccus sp. SDUM812005]MDQ8183007.1 NAD(P)H-dependent oxidoreductase [Pelagicoccus sp. SDUM812005]